jgi:hypothetical protein
MRVGRGPSDRDRGTPTGRANADRYVFIDAQKSRSTLLRTTNLSKVRERLLDAGQQGYVVYSIARSASSLNLLLTRGNGEPQSHRLIDAPGESALVKKLSEAATEGFRVIPDGIKAFEEGSALRDRVWIAMLTKRVDAPPVTYSLAKGSDDAEKALVDADATGRSLVGIVGREGLTAASVILFFEHTDGAVRPPSELRDFRIMAPARTSAMQSDRQGYQQPSCWGCETHQQGEAATAT